jgi:hypothetical protein
MIPIIGEDDATKTRMTTTGEGDMFGSMINNGYQHVITTNIILCAQIILNNNVKLWFSAFFAK